MVVPSGMPHRFRHVSKSQAPRGCFGWDSGFIGNCTLGWAVVRPTWLLQADDPDYYRSMSARPPSFELPAALGSWFTRGAFGPGEIPSLTTNSGGTLESWSARSVSFSGPKDLLASRYWLPQFPHSEESLILLVALIKAHSRFSISTTAWAPHSPSSLCSTVVSASQLALDNVHSPSARRRPTCHLICIDSLAKLIQAKLLTGG